MFVCYWGCPNKDWGSSAREREREGERERGRERDREEKEVKWHYNVKGSFTLEKYNNKGNYIYEKFIIFNYNIIFTVIKMKKSDSKDKDYKHCSTEQNSYIGQDKVHNLINKHL